MESSAEMKFDKVLVTGGAGFIGSHTVDALLDREVDTWVFDNLSTGLKGNLSRHKGDRKLHVVRGNVRSFNSLNKITKEVDAIIHLAAIVSPVVSIKNPEVTNAINVQGTLNVLRAAQLNRISRLVFASSSSVYGDATSRQIDELTLTNPLNPYGVSKLAGERYCASFYTTYRLDTISLRYFNVYGERQIDNPYSGVIAIFTKAMLDKRETHIDGDGKQTRDFVHVTDVARANLAALNCPHGRGEAFNVGTGNSTSINTLHQLIADAIGRRDAKPTYRKPRAGDVKDSCANITKAQRSLKFQPRTKLNEGLARLVDWLRNQ